MSTDETVTVGRDSQESRPQSNVQSFISLNNAVFIMIHVKRIAARCTFFPIHFQAASFLGGHGVSLKTCHTDKLSSFTKSATIASSFLFSFKLISAFTYLVLFYFV